MTEWKGVIPMKKLWNVYEGSDMDGGFGDAVYTETCVGTVLATDEEIEEFLKVWDKPRVYDHPYADLTEHIVRVEEVKPVDIAGFEPYDPKRRDWPDIPTTGDGVYPWYEYDENTNSWFDPNKKGE